MFRRDFLNNTFTALAGIGLLDLLRRDGCAFDEAEQGNWRPGVGQTHHPAKARRVLQIFCPGAASHMDLWDYKPELFAPRRTAASRRREPGFVSGEERQSDGAAVGVRAVRRVRQTDLIDAAPHGGARGRHRVHPLDEIEDKYSRSRLRVDEHGAIRRKDFPAPARGSATRWGAPTRTCRRMWRSLICAASRPTAKRTGATDFCRLGIRRSRWRRIGRYATCNGRRASPPTMTRPCARIFNCSTASI